MTAYYNERDKFCAEWLRNLVTAGLVCPGDVDDRDILDVTPGDVAGYTQCHFFAGLGLWSLALRWAGWPDDRPIWTGSCPCQPFSQAGRGDGFGDDRHVWPAWLWLISECRPVALAGEQVASPDGTAWLDVVSTALELRGYAVGAVDIPVAGLGGPHIRQRLWWVADRRMADTATQRSEPGNGERHRGSGIVVERAGARGDRRDDGATRGLADADSAGRQQVGRGASRDEAADGRAGRDTREPHGDHLAAGHGADGERLADAEGTVGARGERDSDARGIGGPPDGGGLGDAARERSSAGSRKPDARHVEDQPQRPVDADRLGDAIGGGLQDAAAPLADGAGRQARRPAAGGPGRAHDPWRELEWIACRDGRSRPTQSGVFPLAARHPGDVAKLRAYGNAISPVVAAEVIAAWMECQS